MTRGKGESSIYKDARGYWTAAIELPPRNGKRRRKVIRSKDKGIVRNQLVDLTAELRNNGDIHTDELTVTQWLTYWYEKIALTTVRPKTAENYRTVIYTHTIPQIGTTRLRNLTPAKIRQVTDGMIAAGLSSTYALNAHRVLSTAFESAVREGRLTRNPAKLMAAPRRAVANLEVLDLEESIQLLQHVLSSNDDGNPAEPEAAFWATVLLTGARRGEVVGLQADRISDTLDISWQLQRLKWQHGCNGTCPPQRRGANCPQRKLIVPADYEYQHVRGGLFLTRPKSKAGWRIIPLIDPLKTILDRHIAENPPGPDGFIFARNGNVVDPLEYSREWKRLLVRAGIDRDVRFHDNRHAAVDLLTIAGVPDDVIMAIVGHSSRIMTHAYRKKNDIDRMRRALEQTYALFNRPEIRP